MGLRHEQFIALQEHGRYTKGILFSSGLSWLATKVGVIETKTMLDQVRKRCGNIYTSSIKIS